MRWYYFLLVVPLLFTSCKSGNSFTQRKYLPGLFHPANHSDKYPEERNAISAPESPSINALQKTDNNPQTVVAENTNRDSTQVAKPVETVLVAALTEEITQPTDTSRKANRLARKEARRTDQARTATSFRLGIGAVVDAALFFLVGLFLSNGASGFTDEILLLIFLILIILPAYFALGFCSLLAGIMSIAFATKVRKNNKGKEDYPENSKTRTAIILALFGLILLTFASIVTLPHFLDW